MLILSGWREQAPPCWVRYTYYIAQRPVLIVVLKARLCVIPGIFPVRLLYYLLGQHIFVGLIILIVGVKQASHHRPVRTLTFCSKSR